MASPNSHRIPFHNENQQGSKSSCQTEPTENLPPVIVPPYWQQHIRNVSRNSILSITGKPAPIRLEDNTDEPEGVKSPLWAKLVSIESHTIVSGNVKGVGDYVVWNCRVETLDGGCVNLHKRYSEFEVLRNELASTFPRAGSSLPGLPPKSIFYRFRPAFLEKRRAGLEYFLK
jgi:hypothetical protein